MSPLTEEDLRGLPEEVRQQLRNRIAETAEADQVVTTTTTTGQTRTYSQDHIRFRVEPDVMHPEFRNQHRNNESVIGSHLPLYIGKGADQPLPKELLGMVETYNKELRNLTKLNEEFRSFSKLMRASNILKDAGYEIPEIILPEYFSKIDETRLNRDEVMSTITKNIQEIYPNVHVRRFSNSIRVVPAEPIRFFNRDVIMRGSQHYCDMIAQRDPTMKFSLTDSYNGIMLQMEAAASNLYDRDESGRLVSRCNYPWLAEIIDSGKRLPIVVARWLIRTDRSFSPQNLYHDQIGVPDHTLINRHLSAHRCYGSVNEAIRDSKRLKQSIAQGYTALVSMNLFEEPSFPVFSERYYRFWNTETKQVELIDTYYYKCKYCIDRDDCIEDGGNNDCEIGEAAEADTSFTENCTTTIGENS